MILSGNSSGRGEGTHILNIVVEGFFVVVTLEGYGVLDGSINRINNERVVKVESVGSPYSCVVILCGNGSGRSEGSHVLNIVVEGFFVVVSLEGYGVLNGSINRFNNEGVIKVESECGPFRIVVILSGNSSGRGEGTHILNIVVEGFFIVVSLEGYGVLNGSVNRFNNERVVIVESEGRPYSCVVILCGNCSGSCEGSYVLNGVVEGLFVVMTLEGYGVLNGSVNRLYGHVRGAQIEGGPGYGITELCGNSGKNEIVDICIEFEGNCSYYSVIFVNERDVICLFFGRSGCGGVDSIYYLILYEIEIDYSPACGEAGFLRRIYRSGDRGVLDIVEFLIHLNSVSHKDDVILDGSVNRLNNERVVEVELERRPFCCVVILCGNGSGRSEAVLGFYCVSEGLFVVMTLEGYCVFDGGERSDNCEILKLDCECIPSEGVVIGNGYVFGSFNVRVVKLGEGDNDLLLESSVFVLYLEGCEIELGENNVLGGHCFYLVAISIAPAVGSGESRDLLHIVSFGAESGVYYFTVLLELCLIETFEGNYCICVMLDSCIGDEVLDVSGKFGLLFYNFNDIVEIVDCDLEGSVAGIEIAKLLIIEGGEDAFHFGSGFEYRYRFVYGSDSIVENNLSLALAHIELLEELIVDVFNVYCGKKILYFRYGEIFDYCFAEITDVALVELNVCNVFKLVFKSFGELVAVDRGDIKLCDLCGKSYLCVDVAVGLNNEGELFGHLLRVFFYFCGIAGKLDLISEEITFAFN